MKNDMLNPKGAYSWTAPEIITVKDDVAEIDLLVADRPIANFFDATKYAIDELYDIAYPHEKDFPVEKKSNYDAFVEKYAWPKGDFIYFEWSQTLLRVPGKDDLRALKTSRNRNLITADEQLKLYDATIFVAGLSVGSNIVEVLVSMGTGGRFICADMDVIEPSNLNRIRAPYSHIGTLKTDSIAIRMNEIDPYLDFVLMREGLNERNIEEMLDLYKPAVIVDEIDQLPLKIRMRREAKARGIPVVSAADDGDSTLIDVEPYDTVPDYPIFHGYIPNEVLTYLETSTDIPRQQLGLLIGKYFVGTENIPLRMFRSLAEVGKSLPSWPQLGGAATQSGVAVAYACRELILGAPLKHGRFVIGPDQVLAPDMKPEQQVELLSYRQRLDTFHL